jgi:hypothetical protein
MVVGVEPERDLKEDLLISSRPHHAAASFRLPGPPELRVGRERSDTLAISIAVVLEGSLVHSVCIRVVAAHTKPIGGSPLPEKKRNPKEKITFIKKQDLHQTSEFQALKKSILVSTIPVFDFTYTVPALLVKHSFIRVHSKKGLLYTGPPIYALDCLYLI